MRDYREYRVIEGGLSGRAQQGNCYVAMITGLLAFLAVVLELAVGAS